MTENHRFDWVSAVVSSKHVDFSLIEAKLAYVCFQEKDVCALHARIQDLG